MLYSSIRILRNNDNKNRCQSNYLSEQVISGCNVGANVCSHTTSKRPHCQFALFRPPSAHTDVFIRTRRQCTISRCGSAENTVVNWTTWPVAARGFPCTRSCPEASHAPAAAPRLPLQSTTENSISMQLCVESSHYGRDCDDVGNSISHRQSFSSHWTPADPEHTSSIREEGALENEEIESRFTKSERRFSATLWLWIFIFK